MTPDEEAAPLTVDPLSSIERRGYAPPAGRRVLALAGTSLIYALVAAVLFLSFEIASPRPRPATSLTVTLLPLASPPDTPPKPKQAPRPIEKHEQNPTPPTIETVEPTNLPLVTPPTPSPPPVVKPADPAPPQPETAAPKTVTAPPAPQISSKAPDSWEGRVLARLEKFRRYPNSARSARQQGVSYIRFRINREGKVLSSALVRSSGYPTLDRAALETLRRADPLPKIPPDRPDEIELSVPIEFFIR